MYKPRLNVCMISILYANIHADQLRPAWEVQLLGIFCSLRRKAISSETSQPGLAMVVQQWNQQCWHWLLVAATRRVGSLSPPSRRNITVQPKWRLVSPWKEYKYQLVSTEADKLQFQLLEGSSACQSPATHQNITVQLYYRESSGLITWQRIYVKTFRK